MRKRLPRCKVCGIVSKDNLSLQYCSVKCREYYAKLREESEKQDKGDTGSYYDNFVDGKGY